MSMPSIIPSITSRCQAITDIIESIALEQAGISHILNAEGEKLQRVINMPDITIEELVDINSSVQSLVASITALETVFQAKLALFEDCICSCEAEA